MNYIWAAAGLGAVAGLMLGSYMVAIIVALVWLVLLMGAR